MAEAYNLRCGGQPGTNYVIGQTIGLSREFNTAVVIGGKGRELVIAGKNNVLRRNHALVVPMNIQRTAEGHSSFMVEPSPTLELYVPTETGPDTDDTSSTEMHPAPEMTPTLGKSP